MRSSLVRLLSFVALFSCVVEGEAEGVLSGHDLAKAQDGIRNVLGRNELRNKRLRVKRQGYPYTTVGPYSTTNKCCDLQGPHKTTERQTLPPYPWRTQKTQPPRTHTPYPWWPSSTPYPWMTQTPYPGYSTQFPWWNTHTPYPWHTSPKSRGPVHTNPQTLPPLPPWKTPLIPVDVDPSLAAQDEEETKRIAIIAGVAGTVAFFLLVFGCVALFVFGFARSRKETRDDVESNDTKLPPPEVSNLPLRSLK